MRIKFASPIAESVPRELQRSPEWPRVEKAHLQIQPRCVCCTDAMTRTGLARSATLNLTAIPRQKMQLLDELQKPLVRHAFAGEL